MEHSKGLFPILGGLILAISPACTNVSEEETMDTPNILLCIADDVTWMHMSAYGCSWTNTPNFDYVAENGILFNNAYTPNAKCAPSRACILTGRNSWQLKEAANHMVYFPVEFKSFPEVLKEKGFHVGYTGKGYVPGKALNSDGSPRDLIIKRYKDKILEPLTIGIYNDDYTENFKDFMNEKPEDTPFFFWYGGWEPHRSYQYASGAELGGKNIADIDKVPDFWPDVDSVRNDMMDYAFELEYFDKHLGQIIKVLEEKGELDNTIIVVTSDNGMPFPRIKSNAYEMSNHLPLAIMWPKGIKNKGRVINDYVNFIDLAPTFLELAGIDEDSSGMKSITGKSLTNILFSKKEGQIEESRNYALIGKERNDVGRPNDTGYPIRGIVQDSFLYVINFETSRWPSGNPECGYLGTDGSPTKTVCLNTLNTKDQKYWELSFGKREGEEMFNIKTDPMCMVNISEDPAYNTAKDNLKNKLLQMLKEQGDIRMEGKGSYFDDVEVCYENLKDFYNRYMNGENVKAGWVNDSDFEVGFIE